MLNIIMNAKQNLLNEIRSRMKIVKMSMNARLVGHEKNPVHFVHMCSAKKNNLMAHMNKASLVGGTQNLFEEQNFNKIFHF